MAISLEQFVKLVEDSGIVAAETLKDFIPPKQHPQDAEALARDLVRQKRLTKFQAEEVWRGNGKSLILGNYVLVEKIGAGGMGQVYKAQHRVMERIVAVKVLPPSVTKDPAAVQRFHREVKAAAKLNHPNIVTAYDADQARGVHFLVMECVQGQDLSALVKKSGPLPVRQAIKCILQAARGLEFAHKKGVIHRDIKPANLLLDVDGTVKVLDMGLARIDGGDGPAQAELTATGAIMGTVDYMAPEQALSTKQADARADIYSLGCSLCYLLNGKAPYDGETLMSRLLAHRDGPIPSLCTLRVEVPEAVNAIFTRMVAKKVEDRYQTMTDVIADLERCLQSPAGDLSRIGTAEDPSRSPTSALSFALPNQTLGAMASHATVALDPMASLPPATGRNRVRKVLIGVAALLLIVVPGYFAIRRAPQTADSVALTKATESLGRKSIPRSPPERAKTPADAVDDTMPRPDSADVVPLETWLKGREVLTVAQDGSAMFKTIRAAIKALQAGQAVEVLDKGPYHESLDDAVPADTGLVSTVGTRVELTEYQSTGADTGIDRIGWKIGTHGDFRLSGFDIVGKAEVPENAQHFELMRIASPGKVTVHRSRFIMPAQTNTPGAATRPQWKLRTLFVTSTSAGAGDLQIVENEFQGASLDVAAADNRTLLFEKNYIHDTSIGLKLVPKGTTVIRQNVIRADTQCISFWLRDVGEKNPSPDWKGLSIVNNDLLGFNPIYVMNNTHVGTEVPVPTRVTIQNNLLRSGSRDGIVHLVYGDTPGNAGPQPVVNVPVYAADTQIMQEKWAVGHNAYVGDLYPKRSLAPGATDIQFPSGARIPYNGDSSDRQYLRVDPTSALATGGAGGDLPRYIGALVPGVAPAGGDWFTRLREPGTPTADVPPRNVAASDVVPLEAWLKGREVLTVAQDGHARFKSIEEAVKALKPGQVVQVLDQGPYHDNVSRDMPPDTGIVSLVGTRVVLNEYIVGHDRGHEGRAGYCGWRIFAKGDFRLSGITIIAEADIPERAITASVLFAHVYGGATIDRCKIALQSKSGARPRTNLLGHATKSLFLTYGGTSAQQVTITDSEFFGGQIDLVALPPADVAQADFSFERNFVHGHDYGVTVNPSRNRMLFRQNVILSENAVAIRLKSPRRIHDYPETQIALLNNHLFGGQPIMSFNDTSESDNLPLLKNVRIENNLMYCKEGRGIYAKALTPQDQEDRKTLQQVWVIRHNAYIGALSDSRSLPAFATEFTVPASPLPYNNDANSRNYLRVQPSSLIATGGAGGVLPTFIGALAPGDAPPQGDWFTQLRERGARDVEVGVEEPPPLEEWLKGRDTITVAQNGSGNFTSIGEAVLALKPGQVVQVLDKGPYRESLFATPPADTGVVSAVGTRVELDAYSDDPLYKAADRAPYFGWNIRPLGKFRLHGITLVAQGDVPSRAVYFSVFQLSGSSGLSVDHCRILFRAKSGGLPRTHLAALHTASLNFVPDGPGIFPVNINDNEFAGARVVIACGSHGGISQADIRFEHNWMHGSDYGLDVTEPGRATYMIRHNVVQGVECGVVLVLRNAASGKDYSATRIALVNNLLFGKCSVGAFNEATLPADLPLPRHVQIQNNLLHCTAGKGILCSSNVPNDDSDVKSLQNAWKFGNNAYFGTLQADHRTFAVQPTDIRLPATPVPYNNEPASRDYLRFDAASLLANGGAGGQLDEYIGALPPGPPPPQGDWFTRLREAATAGSRL